MRRIGVKLLVGAGVLVLAAGLAAYMYGRRSLPQIDGMVVVTGLSGPVEIVRDADDIPHIFAGTKTDALFGLGYVHAQDRLWQMEFQRRIGHGRLSEVFGSTTLSQDRFLRTVGFGRAAHRAWNRLTPATRLEIGGYVAGINAFVSAHRGSRLPPEFTLLGVEPEPWTGPDVLVWVKMMAWDLSANYSFELLRADIAARLGPDAVDTLMPPYPADGLTIVPPDTARGTGGTAGARPKTISRQGSSSTSLVEAFDRGLSGGHPAVRDVLIGATRVEAVGSNNWTVGGTMTAGGSPMLANDPHLSTGVPSTWYLAHLSAGDFDVIGATLPGAPAVALGRNRRIAWGATNVAADVEDLYLERLDAAGTSAEFQGRMEPLTVLREVIAVRGADAVPLTVRVSRHGPLVSDAINANNAETAAQGGASEAPVLDPLALRWTALDEDDSTAVAFLRLNGAKNWTEFTDALREFVAPSQNFVYADVDGHIGYYAPGRIPIRRAGDGSRPAEGWSGDMEWAGWIPFEELPHLLDPPQGFIVTANHRPTRADGGALIGLEFPEPYRAERLTELLVGRSALTVEDFRAMQADTRSFHARALVPRLLQYAEPATAVGRTAIDLLSEWDFDARSDSAAAAIFQAWFLNLAPSLLADDLGDRVLRSYQGRFSHVTRFLLRTLEADPHGWCDDKGTVEREDCRHAVTRALDRGLSTLSESIGHDIRRWRWDDVHHAVFPHRGLDSIPILRLLLSRTVPSAGDWSTVNVGSVSADRPFEQRSVPGYRQIIDLSPGSRSVFLDAVGQSGHFLSPYYDDFLDDWRRVRYRPMRMDRAEIEEGALGRLLLVPDLPAERVDAARRRLPHSRTVVWAGLR